MKIPKSSIESDWLAVKIYSRMDRLLRLTKGDLVERGDEEEESTLPDGPPALLPQEESASPRHRVVLPRAQPLLSPRRPGPHDRTQPPPLASRPPGPPGRLAGRPLDRLGVGPELTAVVVGGSGGA